MSERRSSAPLIVGIVLVVLGALLMLQRSWWDYFTWLQALRFLFPVLFLYCGLSKLWRHYSYPVEQLEEKPRRSSLLSGLFWTALGTVLLLSLADVVDFFFIVGTYWPVLIVVFGIGKVIDFYRLKGRMQFRFGEFAGLFGILLLGLCASSAADTDLDPFEWGWISLPSSDIRIFPRGQTYDFHEAKGLDAAGLSAVEIVNGYGDIRVEGTEDGTFKVEYVKQISERSKSRAEDVADEIALRTERQGDSLTLSTRRGDLRNRDSRFHTNFNVQLPQGLRLKIVNASGSVFVGRMAADCDVKNSRGVVTVEFVKSNVKVDNGFESVTARNIEGRVEIVNQRGSIRVEEVVGAVDVATNRKAITINEVRGGPVTVKNYHGSVRLTNVHDKVDIDAIGSGIQASEIDGDVILKNSYQNVTMSNVRGNVDMQTSNSRVRVVEVNGGVKIDASRAEISGERLLAGFTVQGRGTSVDASEVSGPVSVVTSLKPVRLKDLRGAAEIQNQDAPVTVILESSPKADLTVENSNGEITIGLPSGAGFRLTAQSRGGRVFSEFGPQRSEGADQILDQTVGGGGPKISLQNRFSSIRIRKQD